MLKTKSTLWDIFLQSKAKYKIYFQDKFVCFSPESFVNTKGRNIFSFPMKGTIDASIFQAKQKILDDQKETAEHYTIVDLIRNDLSSIAKKVKVKKFRYIDEIITNEGKLLQVSSEIAGKLPKEYKKFLGTYLKKILPAGSITGAPKEKTLEIIEKAEKCFNFASGQAYKRGYYTGIFGYFDGNNLTSAVMIRFIEKINNELYFKSGGGITYLSKAEEEYQEMIQKVYWQVKK